MDVSLTDVMTRREFKHEHCGVLKGPSAILHVVIVTLKY